MRANVVARNIVKEKLARNEIVASITIRLVRGVEIAQIAKTAAVEGVDMVLIGVNDMLASLGIPGQYEHAKVRDAYARTIAACYRHGKHVGIGGLSTRPKLAAEFIAMGARLVSTGKDIQFLLAAAIEKAKQVREIPV